VSARGSHRSTPAARGGAPHNGNLLRTMAAAPVAQVAVASVATSAGRADEREMKSVAGLKQGREDE
jgi:hypothetical protein